MRESTVCSGADFRNSLPPLFSTYRVLLKSIVLYAYMHTLRNNPLTRHVNLPVGASKSLTDNSTWKSTTIKKGVALLPSLATQVCGPKL